MCRIENNYLPPEPEQYEKLAEYINLGIQLEYLNEDNILITTKGILKNIVVNNYAEYLKIEGLSIRLDKVISVRRNQAL